jgi:hypothetical protein
VETTKIVSANGLSTLLRNRAYLGERIYNSTRRTDKKTIRLRNDDKEIVRIVDSHPAIIPKELFDRVQIILDHKKPKVGRQTADPKVLKRSLTEKPIEKSAHSISKLPRFKEIMTENK